VAVLVGEAAEQQPHPRGLCDTRGVVGVTRWRWVKQLSSHTLEGCAAGAAGKHSTMASAEEGVPPSGAGLADEIRAMKPSGRRKRATAAGATDDEVEACEDADDPVVAVSPRHVGPLSSLRCLAAIGPRCSASLCFATVLDSSWS